MLCDIAGVILANSLLLIDTQDEFEILTVVIRQCYYFEL
jgi:hypothetical protein